MASSRTFLCGIAYLAGTDFAECSSAILSASFFQRFINIKIIPFQHFYSF